MRIFLLGEGNFSFTNSLINNLSLYNIKYSALVTSSYDSIDDLHDKYPESRNVLTKINKSAHTNNIHILHNIDATKNLSEQLPIHPDIPLLYDHIIFNFPHLGIEDSNIHSSLLAHFLDSTLSIIYHNTFVYITLTYTQYINWKLTEMAYKNGFIIVSELPLLEYIWQGYEMKRHHRGKSFRTRINNEQCITYCLRRTIISGSGHPAGVPSAIQHTSNLPVESYEVRILKYEGESTDNLFQLIYDSYLHSQIDNKAKSNLVPSGGITPTTTASAHIPYEGEGEEQVGLSSHEHTSSAATAPPLPPTEKPFDMTSLTTSMTTATYTTSSLPYTTPTLSSTLEPTPVTGQGQAGRIPQSKSLADFLAISSFADPTDTADTTTVLQAEGEVSSKKGHKKKVKINSSSSQQHSKNKGSTAVRGVSYTYVSSPPTSTKGCLCSGTSEGTGEGDPQTMGGEGGCVASNASVWLEWHCNLCEKRFRTEQG